MSRLIFQERHSNSAHSNREKELHEVTRQNEGQEDTRGSRRGIDAKAYMAQAQKATLSHQDRQTPASERCLRIGQDGQEDKDSRAEECM